MQLPLHQVDAFTTELFRGNPAAVVPLSAWPPDALLQNIALENNLSETAFLVQRSREDWELRWFTPAVEVDLCGHATLASAYVVCHHHEREIGRVVFHTKSGALPVTRGGELFVLDFPRFDPVPVRRSPAVAAALGREPAGEFTGASNRVAVFRREAHVRALKPDFAQIAALDEQGLIATAPGEKADFVSRYFAPKVGIDEDPVTGSTHSLLAPFWHVQLEKAELRAQQVSARGGELKCIDTGRRVLIAGAVTPYLQGTIEVPG